MSNIINVNAENFDEIVLKADKNALVVVDFWAPWCAPCRMLVPVLEQLTQEYDFTLAKVNTQEQESLAQRFSIRGIPDVRFYKGGEQVSGFSGALRKEQVAAYLEKYTTSFSAQGFQNALAIEDAAQRKAAMFEAHKIAPNLKVPMYFFESLDLEAAKLAAQEIKQSNPLYRQAANLLTAVDFLSARADFAEIIKQKSYETLIDELIAGAKTLDESTKNTLIALLDLIEPASRRVYQRKISMLLNS
ncbi:MAG: thioredoxin family protein [Helicobacteraceae bacterium]